MKGSWSFADVLSGADDEIPISLTRAATRIASPTNDHEAAVAEAEAALMAVTEELERQEGSTDTRTPPAVSRALRLETARN